MEVVKKIAEMQRISDALRASDKKIAVVPTMGYLHEGHTSLIRTAKQNADIVITTLFVNPTQFAPNEDFEKYPRDFDRDFELAQSNGSDYLFMPEVLEMYPIGYSTLIDVSGITANFEGLYRPTHFAGVATVVAKLFNATKPHIAIFGQKDYQQCMLIRRLVKDMNYDIEIIVATTIRESDGLAKSSRNTYLSKELREKAAILFIALEEAKKVIARGETDRKMINSAMHQALRTVPEIKIDYAASADSESLETSDIFLPGERIVLLIAVYLGKTRLIDNAVVTIPSQLNEMNFIKQD